MVIIYGIQKRGSPLCVYAPGRIRDTHPPPATRHQPQTTRWRWCPTVILLRFYNDNNDVITDDCTNLNRVLLPSFTFMFGGNAEFVLPVFLQKVLQRNSVIDVHAFYFTLKKGSFLRLIRLLNNLRPYCLLQHHSFLKLKLSKLHKVSPKMPVNWIIIAFYCDICILTTGIELVTTLLIWIAYMRILTAGHRCIFVPFKIIRNIKVYKLCK